MFNKICAKCGIKYVTNARNRKYCDSCKGYHRRERQPRKLKYNCNLFENDIEGLSYFLGFCYSDGYYDKNYDKLSVFSTDFDIIDKIHNRLNYDAPILYHRKDTEFKDIKRITLYGKNAKYFNSLGFINNKKKLRLPKFEGFNIYHFLRGFLDGDGTLSIKNTGKLSKVTFLGNKDLLEDIVVYLNYGTPRQSGNIYQLSIGGRFGLDLLDKMYKDATIYMDRKYNKYKSLVRYN